MAALSTVIYMLFPEIPLVPGIDYLKLDFSDIPAIITSVTLGPVCAVIVEVIKNIIHLTVSTSYGIGEIMNVGIGATVVFSLSLFSKLFAKLLKKDTLNAGVYYISACISVLLCILAGWLLNLIFTPVYFMISGIPLNSTAIFAGVWGSTLLNTVKAVFNLFPFYPVYFAIYKFFIKING